MSDDVNLEPEADSAPNVESISWRVRLSDKAPRKLIVIGVSALLALGFGTILLGALIGGLGFAIILGSTAEFWWGTAYRIDAKGASSRTLASLSSISWEDVKRVVVTGEGIKLSPLAEGTSRMSVFRGVFLRYGLEGRTDVEAAVRRLCKDDVRYVEGGADGSGS